MVTQVSQETIQKTADTLEAGRQQAKKDGDIIAVLRKTVDHSKQKINKLAEEVKQKDEKIKKQESVSKEASEEVPRVEKERAKQTLQKLAEDGVMEETHIDAHADKAVSDPSHLLDIMDYQERQLRETKQAKEGKSLGRVGQLDQSADTESFDRNTDKETREAYKELDRTLGQEMGNTV